MIIPFYIQLFVFTLFVCVWKTQGQYTVDEAALKASSSQSSSLGHRWGRMLSEHESSNDGQNFTDESSSTIISKETDSTLSDFNEEDENYLQHYLSSRIHRERGDKRRKEFHDFVGSLDSLDSLSSRKKLLKKILSHLSKSETFDYDELMDYVDTHLEGEQKEKMKLLVNELKKYKVKYLSMKSRFKSNMNKLRKKMKQQIMFLVLLVPSITSLFVLLWIIVSMTMCGPGALACAPVLASTVVTPVAAGAAAGAAGAAASISTSAAAAAAGAGVLSKVMIPTKIVTCGSLVRIIFAPIPVVFI